MMSPGHQAFWIGALSASALPLGAMIGVWWSPSSRVVAAVMACGSGSLVAALTLELVTEALHQSGFLPMAFGALAGGGIFVWCNRALNAHGGFLRKKSTAKRVLGERHRDAVTSVLTSLSRVPIFRALPAEDMARMIPFVQEQKFESGEMVVRQGEEGDALYMVVEGQAEVVQELEVGTERATVHQKESVARLGSGEIFGEMALLTGQGRAATVRAVGPLEVLRLRKEDFDRLVARSPQLGTAVEALRRNREQVLTRLQMEAGRQAEAWLHQALQFVRPTTLPTSGDLRAMATVHAAAPLAICLGTILDGIPESVVVGSSLVHQGTLNLSLIAGVFLSNFPESMSSAVGMRQMGYPRMSIIGLWMGLMFLTGVGSWAGLTFFQGASPLLFAMLEGAAAGAMLTMVAETMMPEAYEHGSSVVGIATLVGFLATVFLGTVAR